MATLTEDFPGLSTRVAIDSDPIPTDEIWTQFGDDFSHQHTEVGLDSSSPPGGIERLTPIIPTNGSPRYAVFGREASQWDAGKITFDAARIDSGDDPDCLYGVFFNYDRSTDDGFAVFVKSKTGALTLVRIDGGQVAGPSSPRAGAGMLS